jgi:hypothetical protein
MAIYQQRAPPPTGEHDLGGMVRSMFRDMLCACGINNLWFKALPKKNISGGRWWGEEATYAMNAKRLHCKPTCFYLCEEEAQKALYNSWRQVPQGISRKKYNKWMIFNHFYTKFCMAQRKLMRPPWEVPPQLTDWKQQNWCDLMPWLYPHIKLDTFVHYNLTSSLQSY